MLWDNLPPFVAEIDQVGELLAAQQPAIDELDDKTNKMLMEFFVDSITEKTIELWEDFLGFDHPAFSLERRRERIAARLMVTVPLTVALLKETIERIGGVEVDIVELYDEFKVIVQFIGSFGVPKYLPDIKKEMEQIRPYHIEFVYEYLRAYWESYGKYTWAELSGHTLAQVNDAVPLQKE